MRLTRPTVLILSANPAFARELAAHWPTDSNSPEFTVLEQGLFRELTGSNYELAIADATSSKHRSELKQALAAAGRPAILVHSDSDSDLPLTSLPLRELSNSDGPVVELSRVLSPHASPAEKPSWPTIAGLLGREILRRCRAEDRASDAEAVCTAAQADATLGRYIAEMRHNVNNALTSVLGNAELLTLEPGLPANVLLQAETILNMALRLHEVFQRLASIEKELSVAARRSGRDIALSRPAAIGR
jgi:hypothetical protein